MDEQIADEAHQQPPRPPGAALVHQALQWCQHLVAQQQRQYATVIRRRVIIRDLPPRDSAHRLPPDLGMANPEVRPSRKNNAPSPIRARCWLSVYIIPGSIYQSIAPALQPHFGLRGRNTP